MGLEAAILLIIFTIIIPLIPLLINKGTSKLFSSRTFTLLLGIVLLLMFFAFRYVWYIFDYIEFTQNNTVNGYLLFTTQQANLSLGNYEIIRSIIFGNLMFTNVTDLFCFLLPVSLIIFGTRSITKIIATIGIVAVIWYSVFNEAATDWGQINYGYLSTAQGWEYVFVSNGVTRFPFVLNALFLYFASSTIIASKEYSRWSIFSAFIITAIIVGYINVMINIYPIIVNASGFSAYDWNSYINEGYISYFGPFTPFNTLSRNTIWTNVYITRVIIALVWYALMIIIFVLKNLLTSWSIKVNYIFKPWYEHSRVWRSFGYFVDSIINNFLWKFVSSNYLTAECKFNLPNQLRIIHDGVQAKKNAKIQEKNSIVEEKEQNQTTISTNTVFNQPVEH